MVIVVVVVVVVSSSKGKDHPITGHEGPEME